jgi:uncharacterized protein with gpF-like domain
MNWEKQQRIYERKAYRIIQRHLKMLLGDLPINNISELTYPYIVSASITDEKIKAMLLDVYTNIGFDYAKKVNSTIENTKKDNILFNDALLKEILLFLTNKGGIKITSIKDTLTENVIDAIKQVIGENGTLIDIQNVIYNITRRSQSFYKWQALRIARTETTFSANFAAIETAKNSTFEIEKTWISAKDDRTRHDHLIENGKKVDFDKPFKLDDGTLMMFPGDTDAPAKQVINCRCTVGFKGKRDADGFLIMKKQ